MSHLWWTAIEPLIEPLAWTLVHFLWQGSLVAMALGATLFLLRHADARWRYGVSCAALVLMALAPLVTFAVLQPGASSPSSSAATAEGSSTEVLFVQWTHGATHEATGESPGHLFDRAMPWLVSAWMLGVFLLGLMHLRSWRQLQQTRNAGVRPAQPFWQERADALASRLGLVRRTTVLLSDRVHVPSVVGWLRPVILLPASCLSGLTVDELEMILLHELAHVRRRDYLVNLLQVGVETLLFYHPAVWWVSRQIRIEREVCCDDAAIAVRGDARAYAMALTRVEALRATTPSLAMGSDGGSLLHRVRRLAGHPTEALPATRRPALAASLLVLSTFTALTLLTLGQEKTANAAFQSNEPEPVALAEADEDEKDQEASWDSTVRGRWSVDLRDEHTYLELRVRQDDGGRSQFGLRIDPDKLDGFRSGDDVTFRLRRAAGTFTFEGDVDADHRDGGGRFDFTPREGFEKAMRERDVDGLDREDVYVMAALDVGPETVDALRDLGLRGLGRDELIAMGIHGATPAFVADMIDRGVESRDPDRFVEMRIHGVSADFVDAVHEAGYDTKVENLVQWRIHGVSPDFIHTMTELGYGDLDADELVQMRIHGVSPEFLERVHTAGYEDMDAERAVEWKIHGVSPEFIEAMAELGYDDLDPDELVQMRIHGVSPEWVKSLQAKGLEDISAENLIKMRIHGIEL